MFNIYFVGVAGAGKTYSSQFLIDKYSYIPAKFAYPVYDLARNYFNMQGKDRKLLQVLGTDVARETIDKDIWINRFVEDIKIVTETYKKLYESYISFVLDDCRFINEHELLKNRGWIGIYLDVPDEVRIQRLCGRDGTAQEHTLQHSSELELNKFKDDLDYKIDCSGTIENTRRQIDNIINILTEKRISDGIR